MSSNRVAPSNQEKLDYLKKLVSHHLKWPKHKIDLSREKDLRLALTNAGITIDYSNMANFVVNTAGVVDNKDVYSSKTEAQEASTLATTTTMSPTIITSGILSSAPSSYFEFWQSILNDCHQKCINKKHEYETNLGLLKMMSMANSEFAEDDLLIVKNELENSRIELEQAEQELIFQKEKKTQFFEARAVKLHEFKNKFDPSNQNTVIDRLIQQNNKYLLS